MDGKERSRRAPKTKIIATLGPASNTQTVLRKMFVSGLDMVRLNFSHGSYRQHLERIKIIRGLNKKMRRAVKIMQDLEGYRMRTGSLIKPVQLKKGATFYLTQEDIAGDDKEIPFDYKGPLKPIGKAAFIYVNDGKLVLEVKGIERKRIKVRSLSSGWLEQYKGINIPDANLSFESLTQKDRKDLKIAIGCGLDYIAQSFVSRGEDIALIKDMVKPRLPECKIFAKIENREALSNLDEIIDESDGIIIARGDLGISVPIHTVPIVQKEIIKSCHLKNKPVVVATQMLESMIEEPLPTRAEVSDVANAIFDGASHLLLSAETAIGKHPHQAVYMMNKIIKSAERYRDRLTDLR